MDLNPCPFCGSSNLFVERADYSSAFVQCNGCAMRGPIACQKSDDEEVPGEADARAAWNSRAAEANAKRYRAIKRYMLQHIDSADDYGYEAEALDKQADQLAEFYRKFDANELTAADLERHDAASHSLTEGK